MKTLSFTAYGTPKGQPRARACIRGKHAGVYDPGTSEEWKFSVRSAAKDAWDGVKFSCPLEVRMEIYWMRPKNHSTRKGLKPDAPKWHSKKPDCDNAAKTILDALTTLGIWEDDSRVAILTVIKKYSNTGFAVITVQELTS